MGHDLDTGRIYTVTQSLAAMSSGQFDAVSLVASTLARLEILKLEMQQGSSTLAGGIVELWRGSTGGSTAAAITAVNRNGWAAAPLAVATVTGASTGTLNSTSSAARLHAGGFEYDSGKYCYEPCFPPVIEYLQRFHARVTPGPTTGSTTPLAVTLTFRELGRVPN